MFILSFRPTPEFLTQSQWRRHYYRSRAANFALCSAIIAIEQRGFFTVPHYCDTGHPFIMVISKDPLAFSSWAVTTCFYHLSMSRLGFELPNIRLRSECSSPLRKRSTHYSIFKYFNFDCNTSLDWLNNLNVKNISIRTTLYLNFVHFKRKFI